MNSPGQEIIKQAVELITPWGVVGVLIAPFAGPLAVQRIFKNLPAKYIGKRKSRRRRYTLSFIAALITFIASLEALKQEYTNLEGVIFIAVLVALFQFGIIELVFARADKKNPALAEKLSKGIWVPEDEMSDQTRFNQIKTRVGQAILGGGVDRRNGEPIQNGARNIERRK